MIRIVLIEDQVLLRDSLTKLIDAQKDLEVVAAIGAASQALEVCRRYKPELVITDVMTDNNENGIVAAKTLREEFPDLKIIIMTGMADITFIKNAKQVGADSFIYKNVRSELMLAAIYSTMEGYKTYPQQPLLQSQIDFDLTDDEIAILRLICEAKSRKEVAKELNMSDGSVKAAISTILNKTGYDSILKFAIFAVSNGYISPVSNLAP
jgi:DNA-binding NarL/FixJ family response regulator